MSHLAYSIVIATYERSRELAVTLASLLTQTRLPQELIVVDASTGRLSEAVCRDCTAPFPIIYQPAEKLSSAAQRNQGAALTTAPIVVFLDDDVTLSPDLFARCLQPFDDDDAQKIAGIAARIEGQQHSRPRGLLWWYYRLQAGYRDSDYAGRLFGPAINTLPAYRETDGELIPAEWLPTTCVLYRRAFFEREKFPAFEGYSFMEDAYLAARLRQHGQLFFHKTALFKHHDATSPFKKNVRELARTRLGHQRLIAREVLHLREPALTLKLLLHRLFITIYLLRCRRANRWQEIVGVWT